MARANKLGLSDASVRQKLVQVLGDVIMLAVSYGLILVGSQTKSLFEKKGLLVVFIDSQV